MTTPFSALRLLLVDDDLSSRLTAAVLLEEEGFAVETASSLATGRQLLEDRSYALVLLDLKLRDGLGIELVPLLRAKHPHSKVVLLSGDVSQISLREVDGAFEKAGDFRDLMKLLRGLLGQLPR